jgi:hypothetical protein
VAISFAGPQRALAERLAAMVHDAEYDVFYDGYLQPELWGKDLAVELDNVYQRESRYCVMIVSKEYAERMWTLHERRSALARAIQERGNDYILPIKVDATELPGLVPTIAYLALNDHPLDEIGKILLRKLQAPTAR